MNGVCVCVCVSPAWERELDMDPSSTQQLNELAHVLLDRSYHLSALELYMESLEHGVTIASLAEFFASFRPEASGLRNAPATDDELMHQGAQQLLQRLKESEEKLSLARCTRGSLFFVRF